MIRFTEPGYSRRAVLLARAHEARRWASMWAAAAVDLPRMVAARSVQGVTDPRDAEHLATEWHARAELAEAYAKREVAS